jgi:hypothetical protein
VRATTHFTVVGVDERPTWAPDGVAKKNETQYVKPVMALP